LVWKLQQGGGKRMPRGKGIVAVAQPGKKQKGRGVPNLGGKKLKEEKKPARGHRRVQRRLGASPAKRKKGKTNLGKSFPPGVKSRKGSPDDVARSKCSDPKKQEKVWRVFFGKRMWGDTPKVCGARGRPKMDTAGLNKPRWGSNLRGTEHLAESGLDGGRNGETNLKGGGTTETPVKKKLKGNKHDQRGKIIGDAGANDSWSSEGKLQPEELEETRHGKGKEKKKKTERQACQNTSGGGGGGGQSDGFGMQKREGGSNEDKNKKNQGNEKRRKKSARKVCPRRGCRAPEKIQETSKKIHHTGDLDGKERGKQTKKKEKANHTRERARKSKTRKHQPGHYQANREVDEARNGTKKVV